MTVFVEAHDSIGIANGGNVVQVWGTPIQLYELDEAAGDTADGINPSAKFLRIVNASSSDVYFFFTDSPVNLTAGKRRIVQAGTEIGITAPAGGGPLSVKAVS